jgi:hypothetical protein
MAITLRSKSAQAFVKEMVHENWKTMREERSVLEQTWKRCLMAYLCEFDKAWVDYAKKAGRSHRYVAISWDSVETITPQIYDTIFGSENSLKVTADPRGRHERVGRRSRHADALPAAPSDDVR